jgi:Trypsin-co-occurring domain 1
LAIGYNRRPRLPTLKTDYNVAKQPCNKTRQILMAREILELNAEEGQTILVAVDIPEEAVDWVVTPGEPPMKKLNRNFEEVKDAIVRGCRPLSQAFEQLRHEMHATDAEVEFGINFTSKGNIYLAESPDIASIKVKVTWNLSNKS